MSARFYGALILLTGLSAAGCLGWALHLSFDRPRSVACAELVTLPPGTHVRAECHVDGRPLTWLDAVWQVEAAIVEVVPEGQERVQAHILLVSTDPQHLAAAVRMRREGDGGAQRRFLRRVGEQLQRTMVVEGIVQGRSVVEENVQGARVPIADDAVILTPPQPRGFLLALAWGTTIVAVGLLLAVAMAERLWARRRRRLLRLRGVATADDRPQPF